MGTINTVIHAQQCHKRFWKNVEIEPIMKEFDPSIDTSSALQADFKINGIWESREDSVLQQPHCKD